MNRKFKFTTPVNEARLHHGDLLVRFYADGDDIELDSVVYIQAYTTGNRADITYLLQEHAPTLYNSLIEMAKNLLATNGIPRRGQKIMEG